MSTNASVLGRRGGEAMRGVESAGALRYVVPLGRLLLSLIFIVSGARHFAPDTIASAANQGVPAAHILVPASGLLAIAGGMSILLGYHARFGAWLLVAFLVPVTLGMHAFWAESDPAAVTMQQSHFMKNLGLLGGALLLTWFGAGPISLDHARNR